MAKLTYVFIALCIFQLAASASVEKSQDVQGRRAGSAFWQWIQANMMRPQPQPSQQPTQNRNKRHVPAHLAQAINGPGMASHGQGMASPGQGMASPGPGMASHGPVGVMASHGPPGAMASPGPNAGMASHGATASHSAHQGPQSRGIAPNSASTPAGLPGSMGQPQPHGISQSHGQHQPHNQPQSHGLGHTQGHNVGQHSQPKSYNMNQQQSVNSYMGQPQQYTSYSMGQQAQPTHQPQHFSSYSMNSFQPSYNQFTQVTGMNQGYGAFGGSSMGMPQASPTMFSSSASNQRMAQPQFHGQPMGTARNTGMF